MHRADVIAQPRLRRVVRHDIDGHIPVDGLELRENGLQDRVVASVALAVGAADEHAGFFLLRLRGAAQDGLVDLDLLADRCVDGEFVRSLFVEILAQLLAHGARFGQPRHARAERLRVLRLKEQTGHAVLDDIRDAADIRRDGRAAHARALGDGVGEGLGDGRERVDVERVVEAVHIRDPARKHNRALRAGLRGKCFKHLALLALARDQQADIRVIFDGDGKAADERRHILDRVEPGRDAEDDGIVPHLQANRAQIVLPPELRRDRGKIDAVVDGEHRLRVKASGDEQLGHRVGYADVIVEHAQRDGIDRAVGQAVQGPAEIVQPVIGMDRRDDRHADLPAKDRAGQICARAVAMDNLKALLTDHLREPPDSRADGNLHHAGVDTKLPGVLGKFTLAETDEPHLLRLSKTMQQRQHVRLRAADVAARDQCYHFHIGTLIFELPLVSCGKIQ